MSKFKVSKLTIVITTLVENLPRSMHGFLGVNLSESCVLSEEIFKNFTLIWSHVNENEKKW